MYRSTILLILTLICVQVARPDSSNLAGGVLIAHHPAAMPFSTNPPPEGWCARYLANYALASCDDQVNRIDGATEQIWFVLAAWSESKEWRGVEFGLGPYSTEAYLITDHGPCFPSTGLTIPTAGWPGPNEGTSLAVSDSSWTGNFVPVYYFVGYAYAPDVVPLSINPATLFAGAANGANPPEQWPTTALGRMGMLTDGLAVCSDTTDVQTAPGEPPEPLQGGGEPACEFPWHIEVAAGNAFNCRSGPESLAFGPGDTFTLDYDVGTLYVNGVAVMPPLPTPPSLRPVEELRRYYGSVPFVLEHLHGQGIESWNAAVRYFKDVRDELCHAAMRRYSDLVRQGIPPEEAAEACVASILQSELVQIARRCPEADDSVHGKRSITVVLKGLGPVGWTLQPLTSAYIGPPRPTPLSPGGACAWADVLARLERPNLNCHVRLLNGSWDITEGGQR